MFIWFLSCSAPQAKFFSFLLLVHSFPLIKIMLLQCNIPKNSMNISGTFSRSDELSPCTLNFLHVHHLRILTYKEKVNFLLVHTRKKTLLRHALFRHALFSGPNGKFQRCFDLRHALSCPAVRYICSVMPCRVMPCDWPPEETMIYLLKMATICSQSHPRRNSKFLRSKVYTYNLF